MRKRIVPHGVQEISPTDQHWLALDRLAQVEITSEDAAHPIESALRPDTGPGWQAARPGEQTIRLLFDAPMRLSRIRLVFDEAQHVRTQEFALRWSSDGGQSYRPLVRQQYNFSPPATTREVEDYTVNLDGVTALELSIVPDISKSEARASLARLQLAQLA
jgi:hypothetical protein